MRRRFNARFMLTRLEDRVTPTVTWTGNAGDGQWTTPGNWSPVGLPGPGSDVLVSNGQTVNYNGAATTIHSLTLQAGYLSVMAGSMNVTAGLTINPQYYIQTQNSGTSFTASGATTVDGASINAYGGTTVTLNGLTTVTANAYATYLQAISGTISMPNLTSITGTDSTQWVYVNATGGGSISIPTLTQLTSGSTQIDAQDAGSVINANGLNKVDFNTANDSFGNLYATGGGQLNVSASLTKINHINFHVEGAASFPTSQLTDITLSSVYVYGSNPSFANVSTMTGDDFYAENSSTVTLSNLATLTGSANYNTYLQAEGGSTLSLPVLTTYNLDASNFTYIRALSGSTLTFGALTKFDTGYVDLLAQDANSNLNMPMLGSITFPSGTYGNLTAQSGGQMTVAASFKTLNSLNFTIDGTNAFPVAQLTGSVGSNIYVNGGSPVFTNLAKFDIAPGGYDTIRTQNAGTVASFPAMTIFATGIGSYDYLQASSGSTLSAPEITSITGGFSYLQANGTGSVLDLPGLATISFDPGYYGFVDARSGGKINVASGLVTLDEENFYVDTTNAFPVGQLTSITNSDVYVQGGSPTFTKLASATYCRFETDYAGTVASFPALTSFISNPATNFTYLLANSGSTLSAPALTTLNSGNVELASNGSGSVLDLPALSSIVFPNISGYQTYGYIYAQQGGVINVAPGLTSLDEENFYQDGTTGFPIAQLTSITNSNIYLQGGSPTFTKLASASNCRLEADNSGTMASFPALTNFISNPVSTFAFLITYSGGTLSAPALTTLNTGNVEISAQGTGSVVNLPALTSIVFPYVMGGQTYGYIYATTGGQIDVAPGLTTLDEENFYQDTAAGFPDGQLTSITNSNVYLQGGTDTFTKLTSATNTRLEADYAGTVASFPVMTNFSSNNGAGSYLYAYYGAKLSAATLTTLNTGNVQLQAHYDSGSPSFTPATLDLPALTTVTPPVGAYGYIYAFGGNTQINTAPSLHLADLSFQFDNQTTFNFANLQLDSNVTTNGYGKLPGNVSNDGFLDIQYDSPNTLEITGNYTQTSNGTLRVDLSGLTQGAQYDWLHVDGTASLDGTVTVQYLSGYIPALGNSYTPISAASRTGNFVNYNNLIIGGGLEFSPTYDATSFKLTAVVSTGPYVNGFTPTGTVFGAVDHLDVTFNKPINVSTVTAPEVVITGPGGPYTLSSIGSLGGNSYRIYLPTLVTSGTYNVAIGPDITSLAGTKMDQNQNGIFGENPGDIFMSSFTIATDDLIVDSVTVPANANFGQTLMVPYVGHNIGNAATPNGASWADYVYLSASGVYGNADNIYIGYGLGSGLPVAAGGTYMGTATVTLPLIPANPDGNYYMIVHANGSGGLTEIDTTNNNKTSTAIALKTPPRVTAVGVNGGDPQRSRVNSFSVTFNQIVTFTGTPAAAFVLTRTGPSGATGTVSGISAVVDNSGGTTTVNFTISGTSTFFVNNSLVDGRYQVKALAAQIHGPNGLALDGNADGIVGDDYMLDSTGTTGVFRLYGDVNGDASVAASDFVVFRQYFGGYLYALDFDNDGAVAGSDFIAFRQRFGGSI
jgi:hypothetical protein